MFEDYAAEVLRDYKRKRAAGSLFGDLERPAPGTLKRASSQMLDQRYDQKDELTLSAFFGSRENKEAYRLAIQRCSADKFRPLNKVLNEGSIKTAEQNIELLAWLIDYQPRPYRRWSVSPGITHEIATPPGAEETPHEPKPGGRSRLSKKIRITIAFSVMIVLGMILYTLWPKPRVSPSIVPVTHHGSCMYWAGDHFTRGSYEVPHHDTPAYAMDTVTFANFRKIADISTLSENSVRKVWYAKIKGKLEVFTRPGFHPVDTSRRLLPLTDYMWHKYIKPLQH